MKQLLPPDCYPPAAQAFMPSSNLTEIANRFNALCGQHAAVTEKLRDLHDDTTGQTITDPEWQDLKEQVINLRFEIENFNHFFINSDFLRTNFPPIEGRAN